MNQLLKPKFEPQARQRQKRKQVRILFPGFPNDLFLSNQMILERNSLENQSKILSEKFSEFLDIYHHDWDHMIIEPNTKGLDLKIYFTTDDNIEDHFDYYFCSIHRKLFEYHCCSDCGGPTKNLQKKLPTIDYIHL